MANRDARLDEPMSDARLREIRKGIEFNQMGMDEDEALFAISDLLADNERLRAREAALVAFVALMQQVPPYGVHDNLNCFFHSECDPEWVGPVNDTGYWKHVNDCPVTQARALLAATEPTDATTAE